MLCFYYILFKNVTPIVYFPLFYVILSNCSMHRRLVANDLQGKAARKVPLLHKKKNIVARLFGFLQICLDLIADLSLRLLASK